MALLCVFYIRSYSLKKNSDNCGTNVMINTLTIIIMINGIIARTKGSNVVLPTRAPTNSDTPTGGVINPIAKLATMMIPKWVGSIPIDVTTGSKIGVKITIAAIASMKVPTISKNKLINNMVIIGDIFASVKAVAIDCGTCSRVKIMPNIDAAEMINKITDVVTTDSTNIVRSVCQLICLYTNTPITKP